MHSSFRHPLFLGAALLFIAHQLSQKVWGISLPWADSYLDPLLCMPLLLTGYSVEQAWLRERERISFPEIILITALVALVSEVGFPRWSESFTADLLDVAAYFAGAGLYSLFRP